MAEAKKEEKLQLESIPGWIKWVLITIVSLIIIVKIINFTSNKVKTHQAQAQTYQQVYQAQVTQPSPIINTVDFPDGVNQQDFDLSPDGWVKVITPQGSMFRIDYPNGTKIHFLNGDEYTITSQTQTDWFGVKVGNDVFFLKGTGKASVMIQKK